MRSKAFPNSSCEGNGLPITSDRNWKEEECNDVQEILDKHELRRSKISSDLSLAKEKTGDGKHDINSNSSSSKHSSRHRVLQTLLVLGMTLLHQQKATSAVVAAAAASEHPSSATTELLHDARGTIQVETTDHEKEEDDDFFVTTHDDMEDEDFSSSFSTDDSFDTDDVDESTPSPSNIVIVSTADGHLMGLSKATGELVWTQKKGSPNDSVKGESNFHTSSSKTASSNPQSTTLSESSSLALLEPLVTTTTTARSFSTRDWRTAAVPSLDGKTVYLTAHVSEPNHRDRSSNEDTSRGSSSSSSSLPEVTVTTSIPDLVDRAPFVDNRGRIYNGARTSIAVAVDGKTGEILKVVSTNGELGSSLGNESLFDGKEFEEDESDEQSSGGKKKKRRRNVVWMGRVDHTISIHEPRSGDLDVQFSAGEIKSVRDMILGQTVPEVQPPWEDASSDAAAHLFLSTGDSLSATRQDTTSDPTSLWNAVTTTPSSRDMETCLVATPNGNLAFRNPTTGEFDWVSPVRFDAPVAFALDADSGVSLPIDIVPDASLASNDSSDYLTREIHRQYTNLLADTSSSSTGNHHRINVAKPDPLVGTLPRNGQLFAMPLGRNSLRFQARRQALLSSSSSSTASALHSKPPATTSPLDTALALVNGRHTASYELPSWSSGASGRPCQAGMANFPSCLVASNQDSLNNFLGESDKTKTTTDLVPFASHDSWSHHFNTVVDPPPTPVHAKPPPRKKYQQILRILGSWLPPTLAMIFVVSFELGRRKRQKDQNQRKDSTGPKSDSANPSGVIQVNQNVILGYGGHGTVVYEGSLEGRKVAVKRMLQTYHASADREISLLIESDGHRNVVRYFLKEVRGDFVYLALELCDLSLHELIGHMSAAFDLMQKENWFEKGNMAIPNAVRSVLLQIASGVKHLHRLRIVHRDLKPANILLADSRKSRRKSDMQESIFEIFSQGDYVAKISDMGLGKQIVGQSSYGGSTIGESSLRSQMVNSNGEGSSIVGAGPGSVGWQAPEVMVVRMNSSDMSARSESSAAGNADSNPDISSSPLDSVARTIRSVDIFSLGCIFFSTLVPGSHPFGEWYEREANIMHNRPELDALREISVEAFDLVSSMIERNPSLRPTATQVCDHPYFWSSERRLLFLCGFSDRLENEGMGINTDENTNPASSYAKVVAVERNAVNVVGTGWDTLLDDDLVNNVQRFRTYDPSSVRDLLRLIRNKYHHFEELPDHLKTLMGSKTDGLSMYFEARFPSLLIHCFKVCSEILPSDDPFVVKYSIPMKQKEKFLDLKTSTIPEIPVRSPTPTSSTVPSLQPEGHPIESIKEDFVTVEETDNDTVKAKSSPMETQDSVAELRCFPFVDSSLDGYSSLIEKEYMSSTDAGDVIIWECSTAAKTFNNRGWSRSDDDWVRRTDASLRKPNVNLVRCMDDPKFRTRLCNHWDASCGTSCPMRKKGKCVFAHGPVELRVKEAKRNRWGKLVDKNGDNKNPKHSGGEDTYGAARTIETERKQEGKWNVDKGTNNKGKKGSAMKKKE